MKKLIVVLFTIILTIGFANAYAYDDEITFQNIPWGSSVQEVKNAMINIYGDEKPVLPGFSSGVGYHGGIKLLHAEYLLYQDPKDRVNIAGYNARVVFVFAIGGNADLNLDSSAAETADKKLISVRFTVKAKNEQEAKEDLIKKITDIYGEGVERKNGNVIWEGKNNTAIELLLKSSYPDDTFCIWYGKTVLNEADYLAPTSAPLNTSPNNIDPNNKNGL